MVVLLLLPGWAGTERLRLFLGRGLVGYIAETLTGFSRIAGNGQVATSLLPPPPSRSITHQPQS